MQKSKLSKFGAQFECSTDNVCIYFSTFHSLGEAGWNPAVEQSTKLESSMRNQSGATAKNKSSPSIVPTQQEPIHHIRAQEGMSIAFPSATFLHLWHPANTSQQQPDE